MRKTREETEATRLAIMQSALNTFCEKGYSKTTFEEIAKRINLTKGAVYWHFSNKPDLVAALINDYFERQKAFIIQKMKSFDTLNDILNHFLYRIEFMESSESNLKICFFLNCQMEWSEGVMQKVVPQIRENTDFWYEHIRRALQNLQEKGVITQDITSALLAHMLINNWMGILSGYHSHRCLSKLSEVTEKSFKIIFNGIIKERTENAC